MASKMSGSNLPRLRNKVCYCVCCSGVEGGEIVEERQIRLRYRCKGASSTNFLSLAIVNFNPEKCFGVLQNGLRS